MSVVTSRRQIVIGATSAMIALLFFSINDVIFKFFSGEYALHQVVLIRSVIGLIFLLAFIMPFEGGLHVLRTRRIGAHILRGLCVVFANMMFFLGLASLPLADAVAIFFLSPLLITVLSVVVLKEFVGPRRWAGVGAGLLGVIIMLRPGSSSFQTASLFPLAAAFGYAGLHMFTRKIGVTERASTMAIYIQVVFIVVSGSIGLGLGHGEYASETGNAGIAFLLRGWEWPQHSDYPFLLATGVASAFGGYFISQAYRSCEAALIAPLEYIAMPLAILWGVLVFGEWPDMMAWTGIILIMGSGLYVFWRETVQSNEVKNRPPQNLR